MLLATLPPIHRDELLEEIISHPLVSGARYNTGARSPYTPQETIERLLEITSRYGKKLWIDLKGRQLRIVRWASPNYGRILLNHEIEVEGPARVHFRGSGWTNLKFARGNEIFVDPPPAEAVGEGQAINIIGRSVKVKGYSTAEDFEWVEAACAMGQFSFMLSFVEGMEDIAEVMGAISIANPELALKIESQKGLDFIGSCGLDFSDYFRIVAATDDLTTGFATNKFGLVEELEFLAKKDPNAIFASNVFRSLEHGDDPSLADILALRMCQKLGFKNFMLCDTISAFHFRQAMKFWQDFCTTYGYQEQGGEETWQERFS